MKRNSVLSTHSGRHGSSSPSKAVLVNRTEIADLKVRFRFKLQTEFIKEAAGALNPPESISLFLASAALERAERVLGRSSPVPETKTA